MGTIGSYDISTFSTGIDAEVKRLNSQIDLFWPKEIVQYKKWGISDNMRILDLGCGPGYLIERLGRLFPLSQFSGVEQDPHLSKLAEERLRDFSNIDKIHNKSILDFNVGNSYFDFAIMRLVLEHVPDPVNTLKHIKTFLKPGGKLIVIDNDFYFHLRTIPNIPELDELYSAYRASRRQDGGDPCIGTMLPVYLKKAGFVDIEMDVLISHNEFIGDSTFLHAEGGGIPARLVKNGFLPEKTFNSLIVNWRNMLRTDDHCIFRQLFAAVGTISINSASSVHDTLHSGSSANTSSLSVNNNNSITDIVKDLLAEALSISSDAIDPDQTLINAGLDSIGASDIQAAIQHLYKITISMSELLGGLTLNDVIRLITSHSGDIQKNQSNHPDSLSEKETGSV